MPEAAVDEFIKLLVVEFVMNPFFEVNFEFLFEDIFFDC